MSPTSLQPSLLIHLQATAFKIKNKVQNDKYYLFSNIVALFVALAVVLVVAVVVAKATLFITKVFEIYKWKSEFRELLFCQCFTM